MIKKFLSTLYYRYFWNSTFGHLLRMKFNSEQLSEIKPLQSLASISDLFIWRVDEEWDTTFQLFNISSFLFPEKNLQEKCDLVFFDSKGSQINHLVIELQSFEMRSLDISTLITARGIGSFAVFHYSDIINEIEGKGSHLTERGYIAYHRKNDELKSFCHGNLQALAKTKNGKYRSIVGESKNCSYYPQLILSDCLEFDLVYTNPTHKAQHISITFYDKENQEVTSVKELIPPLGVKSFTIENNSQHIHTLKNLGNIVMWRPILFKYNTTHFDVLHG
jgi:hypothetical protein